MGTVYSQQLRTSIWALGVVAEVLFFGALYWFVWLMRRVYRVKYWSNAFEKDNICGLSFADALDKKINVDLMQAQRYQDIAIVAADERRKNLRSIEDIVDEIQRSRRKY